MTGFSRRKFLGTSAALPLGLAAAVPARANASTGYADTIVSGGKMLTMDPSQAAAEALAVRGNHILAVGSASDIDNLAGPNTKRIDARGMTVTPGFIVCRAVK